MKHAGKNHTTAKSGSKGNAGQTQWGRAIFVALERERML